MTTSSHRIAAVLLSLLAAGASAQTQAPAPSSQTQIQTAPSQQPQPAEPAKDAAAPHDTTCVVEGIMVVGKRKVVSKDCFENMGADQEDFRRVCDAMIKTATAVTEATNMPPPKVAFGNACPGGAVARCKGFLYMPIINHHYKRSAHDLEIARESCLTQGGEWK